ncbi:hypothetical protein ILUMI_13510 [Ignelater luminosus]|uniref:HTH psq-type domain-containing protein n=1 Tax=Ignelater luminosus TaxID=2038154 RepID=A0A8K0D0M3_IGNLU|nr:hypothetical protein ILUMI_13510 [Ignelater luminosus]
MPRKAKTNRKLSGCDGKLMKSAVLKVINNGRSIRGVAKETGISCSDIYNLDETALTTVHNPPKSLGPKGQKQIRQVTSGERGILVTACCIINAAGQSVPSVNFKRRMLNGAPNGSGGNASKSGWITNGFKYTGIWPMNRRIFSPDEFLSSYVTDRIFETPHTEHVTADVVEDEETTNQSQRAETQILTSSQALYQPSQAINQLPTSHPAPSNTTTLLPQSVQQVDLPLLTTKPGLSNTSIILSTPEKEKPSKLLTPELIKPYPKSPPRKTNISCRRKGKNFDDNFLLNTEENSEAGTNVNLDKGVQPQEDDVK